MDYVECLFVDATVSETDGRVTGPMPGVGHFTPRAAVRRVESLARRGVTRFLVFGVPSAKGLDEAISADAPVPRFLRAARAALGETVALIADVGLSPYSLDGHSVVIGADGQPDVEASYVAAGRLAVAFADAGADTVAPCLSLPHQVSSIAGTLRDAGLANPVMPYSAKFSSAFYGPYRQAVRSGLGAARKAYQTDYDDAASALAQVERDESQGACALIVKPSMLYLDVLAQVCRSTGVPVAAYHVSGEYLALMLASEAGGMDRQDLFDEYHSAVERCGADLVIGYAAETFLSRRTP